MSAILSRPQCVETECKHDGNFVVICNIECRHNYSHDAIFILISWSVQPAVAPVTQKLAYDNWCHNGVWLSIPVCILLFWTN